jgi:hypothetical protein
LFVQSRDRREWGLLGLAILGYGLALSPLLHVLTGHEGFNEPDPRDAAWIGHEAPATRPTLPGHSHAPHRHAHAPDSIEHLSLASSPPRAAATLLQPTWTSVWVFTDDVRPREGRGIRLTQMPQGP